MIAKHLDNKLKANWVSKANARRKGPNIPIAKVKNRPPGRGTSRSNRHLLHSQLLANFQTQLSEDDGTLGYEEDDVFEDEESSQWTPTSTTVVVPSNSSFVLYRRIFGFESLRKIWDLLLRYIWTSHIGRSIAPQPDKVVEMEDPSDSEGEDLFQDCEEDENDDGSKTVDSVNFCFSPPAPSFVEALNRPLSSLLLRYDAIFTPTPATPRTFTPATIQSNSSAQSSASNRARLADLSWDNYDLTMLPQSPLEGGEIFGRWSAHHRGHRIPMASCLKTLWSLDSPSYDQLTGSPIAEDVEGEDDEGINSTTHSLTVDSGEHAGFNRIDSRASEDGLHISKGKSLKVMKFFYLFLFLFPNVECESVHWQGSIGLLDDERQDISDIKDCNHNNMLR